MGKVKWFNGTYGFIKTTDKEYFVHHSDITGFISSGDTVNFKIDPTSEQYDKAIHVISEEYEKAMYLVAKLLNSGAPLEEITKGHNRKIRSYAKKILRRVR